jgi:hypothetical protein
MLSKFTTISFFILINIVLSNPDGLTGAPFVHFGLPSGALPPASSSIQKSASDLIQQFGGAPPAPSVQGSGLLQPGSIPQFAGGVTATTVHGSGLLKNVAPIAGSKAAESAVPTILKATETLCTRSQCYQKLGATIEKVVLSETNSQVNYLGEFIGAKFSGYTGPIVSVAMHSPEIISNINQGSYLTATGIATGAVVKYQVGIQSFSTCTAYSAPMLGPYSIIPGIGCSIVSSLITDNAMTGIKNYFNSPAPAKKYKHHNDEKYKHNYDECD